MIINRSIRIPDRSQPGLTMTASSATHQRAHDTFTTGKTTTSKIRGRDNIAIGSWNIRTLRPVGKLKELTHEMERYNWHLLGLREHRWKNSGEEETEETHTTAVEKKININLVLAFSYIRTLKH